MGLWFSPFNWFALLPLGIALHWALHLVYGARRGRSDDGISLILSNAAWLLILAGIVGPLLVLGAVAFGFLLIIAFFLVAIIVVGKYRDAQRRGLLWALAVAAERQLPLAVSARAFAADRSDEMGRRADRLADLLEAGMDLPAALKKSGNPLPIDAELAARLGHETGQFAGSLREAASEGGRYAPVWEPLLQRLAYLVVLVLFGTFLFTFMMLKIVPTFQVIFEGFELELPAVTQGVIQVSEGFVNYWALIAPLFWAVILAFLYGVVYACGWFRWEPPGVAWLTRRYHGALVLRSLAQAVQLQRPLDETFASLARWYPRAHVRNRLRRVAAENEAGHDWCQALHKSGLISAADMAVLRAAERVGNLTWALREMSESAMRRVAHRMGLLLSLVIPMIVILIGVCVGVYAVAFMSPLAQMIWHLT